MLQWSLRVRDWRADDGVYLPQRLQRGQRTVRNGARLLLTRVQRRTLRRCALPSAERAVHREQ